MMTEEEQKDWEDFIVWLDSEDAYKKCFDSDTSHVIKLVAKELKERREDEEYLRFKSMFILEVADNHKFYFAGIDGYFDTIHGAVTAARGK